MSKSKQNLSSTAFFFGAAACLILVAVVLLIGDTVSRPTIAFGGCQLTIEAARTQNEQARGLSGRPTIASDYAMVFPFKNEQPSFWMKGMLTSIDIIWVSDDQVIKVDAQVPPDDGVASYAPPAPIDWVIETAAGRAEACNVAPGTTVRPPNI